MASTITKLPEWKCLTKFIHKKFPKHYLMLIYIYPRRFNFIIAKKTSLPVLVRKKLEAYDQYEMMHLSYAGINVEEVDKVDPMLGMYMRGLIDGGLMSDTVLNFMSHPMLKYNVKFFKFLFKYIATGNGHEDHYDVMRAKNFDGQPFVTDEYPVLWHCAKDSEGWLEEFKILNDLHFTT